MTKKITKRFIAVFAVVMLIVSCFSTTAFAASTWGVGDHYLGYCNITTKPSHLGGEHVFNGGRLQLKPAWKPLDDTSKEVDMYIE